METITYRTITTPCGETYNYALPGETLSTSWDVRADYTAGHYFDPNTLEFFGSKQFETVAPGISVEHQTNAPKGMKWRVQAWRQPTIDGEGNQPWLGCWHGSRAAAHECANWYAEAINGYLAG